MLSFGGESGHGGLGLGEAGLGEGGDRGEGAADISIHLPLMHYHMVLRPKGTSHNKQTLILGPGWSQQGWW